MLHCTFAIYTPSNDGPRGARLFVGTSYIRKIC